jgi:hypothetical protein
MVLHHCLPCYILSPPRLRTLFQESSVNDTSVSQLARVKIMHSNTMRGRRAIMSGRLPTKLRWYGSGLDQAFLLESPRI